jgi:SAM-dependent methyltransferase
VNASAPTPRSAESLLLRVADSEVPLGFVRDGPLIYLAARDRSAAWPVKLLRAGTAEARIGGTKVAGSARLVVARPERERALGLFAAKYGPEQFARWYADPARVVAVTVHDGAAPPPTGTDYRGWIEAEFDNVAADYDRHIFGNRINRLLRDRSLAVLRREFDGRGRLLEIGCGSGVETVPLLEAGHEIVAVDISDRMLDVVRSKARSVGRSEQLTTLHASAGEIRRYASELGLGSFDGAYSTYGAMNCEPRLSAIPPALHAVLAPGAPFVAAVFNRWCAFETVGYTLTGDFRRAAGRWADPVEVGASRFCVDVHAHSPEEFRTAFSPWFAARTWEAVPLLLPPSDLVAYAERFSRRFDRLARVDRFLGRLPGLRSVGDHFLMVLDRTDVPTSVDVRTEPAAAAAREPGQTSRTAPEPPPRMTT